MDANWTGNEPQYRLFCNKVHAVTTAKVLEAIDLSLLIGSLFRHLYETQNENPAGDVFGSDVQIVVYVACTALGLYGLTAEEPWFLVPWFLAKGYLLVAVSGMAMVMYTLAQVPDWGEGEPDYSYAVGIMLGVMIAIMIFAVWSAFVIFWTHRYLKDLRRQHRLR